MVAIRDLVLRTLAEKNGSPTTRDLVLRTLAEKDAAVAATFTQAIIIG